MPASSPPPKPNHLQRREGVHGQLQEAAGAVAAAEGSWVSPKRQGAGGRRAGQLQGREGGEAAQGGHGSGAVQGGRGGKGGYGGQVPGGDGGGSSTFARHCEQRSFDGQVLQAGQAGQPADGQGVGEWDGWARGKGVTATEFRSICAFSCW